MLDVAMCKLQCSVLRKALIAGELMKLRADGQPASAPRRAIEQVTQKCSGGFAFSMALLFLLCALLISIFLSSFYIYSGRQHVSLLFSANPTISCIEIGDFRAIGILFLYSRHRAQRELDVTVAGPFRSCIPLPTCIHQVLTLLQWDAKGLLFPHQTRWQPRCAMQSAVDVPPLVWHWGRDSTGTWQLCVGRFSLPRGVLLQVEKFSMHQPCLLCGSNWAQGLAFPFLNSKCAQHKHDRPR